MANANADKITAFMQKNASKFEYLTKALGDLKVQMDNCYAATQAYLEIMDKVQKNSGVETAVAQGSMKKSAKKAPVVEDLDEDEDLEYIDDVEDLEEDDAPMPPKKAKAAPAATVKKAKKAPVIEEPDEDEDEDAQDEEFEDDEELDDTDEDDSDEDDAYEDVSEEFEDELDEEDDVGDEFEDVFSDSEFEEVRPVKGKAAAAQKAPAKNTVKAKTQVSKKR